MRRLVQSMRKPMGRTGGFHEYQRQVQAKRADCKREINGQRLSSKVER